MRKLLNVVYVSTEGMYISKDGETVLFKKDGRLISQLPSHNLEGIVIFGNGVVTSSLMRMCAEKNIKISFISYTGKFEVSIQSPIKGNVKLRRAQYRISEDCSQSLLLAKSFVLGKLFNCRSVLQRLLRDHREKVNADAVESASKRIRYSMTKVDSADDYLKLLGVEGEAAKNYYGVFENLLTDNGSVFSFQGRSRRPPRDEVNALLSFFYTILAHDCEAALETVGLDPQVGFYHQERPGRSALALDLMEELRPYMVDRFVVSLVNNRQVSKSDFLIKENGAVLLTTEARKSVLQVWQTRKQDIIEHPFFKEKIEVGLIAYSQALLLARYIRGDIDGYPPFLMR